MDTGLPPPVIVPPAPAAPDSPEAQLAKALLERDAARAALDAALHTPCACCGKQPEDSP